MVARRRGSLSGRRVRLCYPPVRATAQRRRSPRAWSRAGRSPRRPTPLPPSGSLARAVALFRAFRLEQTDPAFFYGLLAADWVREVSRFAPLAGARVLDVGGGPGYFADAFAGAGARYAAVDADAGELSAAGSPGSNTVLASGLALPLADDGVDLACSSNVLEHVPDPVAMAEEMLRVTRPGGAGRHLLDDLVLAVGRSRDLAVALPRRPPRRRPVRTAARPAAEERPGPHALPRARRADARVGPVVPARRARRGLPAIPPPVAALGGAGPGGPRGRRVEPRPRPAGPLTWPRQPS